MTKVITVDCDLAWKCIGFTLWSLLTVGLGFGLWIGYVHTFIGAAMWDADKCKRYADEKIYASPCDLNTDPMFWFALAGNIGNAIGIWYMIHRHVKLVEFRCK